MLSKDGLMASWLVALCVINESQVMCQTCLCVVCFEFDELKEPMN